MKRLILASNRLPVHIRGNGSGFQIERADEQTISGLQGFYRESNPVWIGLTELENRTLTLPEQKRLSEQLEEFDCIPLFPEGEDLYRHLHGFSRNTIWIP